MAQPSPAAAPARLSLRPYQEQALAAVKRAYDRGVRRQLLVLPTGSGKTPIAACLPGAVGDPNMVSIAHRLELLEQTMQQFLEWRPDRLANYDPARWPLMVCDEAHRCHLPGTLVAMADGRAVPIQLVREGDAVWAWTGTSWRARRVTRLWVYRYSGPIVELHTASGRVLRTTPSHDIFTRGAKRHASLLAPGDSISMPALWHSGDQPLDPPTPPVAPPRLQALSGLLRRAPGTGAQSAPAGPPHSARLLPGMRSHAHAQAAPWAPGPEARGHGLLSATQTRDVRTGRRHPECHAVLPRGDEPQTGLAEDPIAARRVWHYTGYVYDLEVAHDHNYIANGCLVGNSTAATYLAVFRHFRHLPHDGTPARPDGLLLGITGTAKRTDNVGLGLVFQEVPFTLTLRDLIEDPRRYLVPLRGYLLRGGANLDEVATHVDDGERDFDPHALDRAVNTPARNRLVVDGTRNKALAEGRPTIVFAASVAHGEALAELFRRAGVRAANVHGEMPLAERREILERFRRGELQVLVNCALLLEGIDIPQIAAVVMARPTQSSLLYSQAIGRGTRPHPESGKRDCIVIDFVDNTHKHAASLVSLPTLFGLPPQFNLRGEAAHAAIRRLEDAAAAVRGGLDPEVVQKIRSPEDIPRVFYEVDLLKIAGLPPHLSRLTHFAWQRMPDGALSITIPRPRPPRTPAGVEPALAADGRAEPASLIEIAENAIGHLELRRRTGPEAPAKIAEYEDLETALRSADRLIHTQYRDRLTLLSKSAAWRHEPVTPEQLRALERLRQPIPRDAHGRVLLTRGQASLLIDRAITLRRAQREAAPAASEPPTHKQLRYLRYYRIPIPDGLTKQGASELIGRHRKFQEAARRAPAQPSAQPAHR